MTGSVGVSLEYLVAWYILGVGLAFLAICGAVLVFRGHKFGGYIIIISSLAFPLSFLLHIIMYKYYVPIPLFYYYPFLASHWLLLSLIGGILALPRKGEVIPDVSGKYEDKNK
ncbi:MAG: hypothetical protein OEY24_04235 [Candidatus Bathyarchaeota archaeon]|nr:hypothetical protein [Candidatus Bathyarchaeota archaeon]MDH5494891.1 hypothetical protein [Candidatus Bathyarchaeota archaeon]